MTCAATSSDHCCWIGGGTCPHFDSRRVECRLRRQYGSWDAAHASEEYGRDVRPFMRQAGITVDCGDWPPPGETCASCGVTGG